MGKYMGILINFEYIAIPIYMAMAMGNIWVWLIWLGQHCSRLELYKCRKSHE